MLYRIKLCNVTHHVLRNPPVLFIMICCLQNRRIYAGPSYKESPFLSMIDAKRTPGSAAIISSTSFSTGDLVLDIHCISMTSNITDACYTDKTCFVLFINIIDAKRSGRIQSVNFFMGNQREQVGELGAGNIPALLGLTEARAGNTISSIKDLQMTSLNQWFRLP